MSSQIPDNTLDPALYPPSMTTLVEVDKDYGIFFSFSFLFFFSFLFLFTFSDPLLFI